jgi:hypothetical protein
MALKGRTPEKGGKGLTFTHDKCRGEKPRHGWLSGDVHVLDSHVGEGKSKPCEKVLLGKNAECPGCAAQRAIEPLGYVPLRDQTGKPVCVVVRKERIVFVGNMEPGTPVTYGRDEGRFEGVFVIPRLVDQKWERYFSHAPNDDMGYWLPQFLSVPHLGAAMRVLFAGEQCQPVVTEPLPAPVEPPPPARLPFVPPKDKVYTEEMIHSLLDKRKDDLLRKAQKLRDKESLNGKH